MLTNNFKNHSISEATLIDTDIADAMNNFIKDEYIKVYFDEAQLRKWSNLYQEFNSIESAEEKSFLLNDDMFSFFNDIAPKGTIFGAHPGNGSDFGFWEYEDFEEGNSRAFLEETISTEVERELTCG